MTHPKALYVLFFTEMFERFGYYLMLALMDLYLIQVYKLDHGQAGTMVGNYMALVYLGPILGGIIADRIGFRITITLGSMILALGYFLFGLGNMSWVWSSIVILSIGNGLFKANISALVGKLYSPGDPRRDSAFSIFYMGINIGSLPSALVGGYVALNYGWFHAFCIAGVGMLMSCFIFTWHSSLFKQMDNKINSIVQNPTPLTNQEKERIRSLVIMCFIVVIFWIGFHQNATSLVVWAAENTDLTFGGLVKEVNPVYFGSINPFFVICLTPVIIQIFSFLRKKDLEPTSPTKIAIGMLLTAASFGILAIAALMGGNYGKVSPFWLIGSYFVVTIGELCLSPMGLSMVTKLAPVRMAGLLMGVWMLATAIGNKMSGAINIYWTEWLHSTFFLALAGLSCTAAITILIQKRRLSASIPKEIDNTAGDEMIQPNLLKRSK